MQVCGGSQSFNVVNTLRLLGRWMRMFTIPNQSSVPMAYKEFDDAGRMRPSAYYDRVVDVMEELFKITLLLRGRTDYLTDRYSERNSERAPARSPQTSTPIGARGFPGSGSAHRSSPASAACARDRLYTASTPLPPLPLMPDHVQPDDAPLGLAGDGSTKILRRWRRTPGKRGSFSSSSSEGGCVGWPRGGRFGIAGQRRAEGGADFQQLFLGRRAPQQRVDLQRGGAHQADDRHQHDQPDDR
jgi:hypothetical protein